MKRLSRLLVMAVMVASTTLWAANGVLPGSGTEADPYKIEDLADFDVFADSTNALTYWETGVYTKLACDPNMAGRPYTTAVIAPDTDNTDWEFKGTPFEGIFDGGGHVISNLTIDTAGEENGYIGLFGLILNGEVLNLRIEGGSVIGNHDVGGLLGVNAAGSVSNCCFTGNVSGQLRIGGIVGNNQGSVSDCYSTGDVSGGGDVAGLVGDNAGSISNCFCTGDVRGTGTSAGGLCGNNTGTINNCYATGSVNGEADSWRLGGLCGFNDHGTISNCYSIGSVTGGDKSWNLGGLCGLSNESVISNCYFYLFSGPDNGSGAALEELQMRDSASYAGFDFAGNPNDGQDDYWTIVNGHCPKLTWQTDDGPLVPSPPVTTLSGSGYGHDPFQINNYADFMEFRTNKGLRRGYYILTTDIDLQGDRFDVAVIEGDFGGHFDGNSHVISNIIIDTSGEDKSSLGLFSKLFASVSNLSIENINITGGEGYQHLGGLCGYNTGNIKNCFAIGSVTGIHPSGCVGVLCGFNYRGTISNCYSGGSVDGLGGLWGGLGGLCGRNNRGTIINCYSNSSVHGEKGSENIDGRWGGLGGLCGYNFYGKISNCNATGPVTGPDNSWNLGGLCGYNNNGTISKCHSGSSINGGLYLGGLCGYNDNGTITHCYAIGPVTGRHTTGGLGGLCGYNKRGTISFCYSDGPVTGVDGSKRLGGLCGYLNCGTISNCYSESSVISGHGSENLGGLCGFIWSERRGGPKSKITNCYATGSIICGDESEYLGGLCGRNYFEDPIITRSFWDIATGGPDNGLGTPLPTDQMQKLSTFINADWDFTNEYSNGTADIWRLCIDRTDYPRLAWEYGSDYSCPQGVSNEDLLYLSTHWLETSIDPYTSADRTGDGVVNLMDYALLARQWLSGME